LLASAGTVGSPSAPPAAATTPQALGAADESQDFPFPGADLMRIGTTNTYVAYGASRPGAERLPYATVDWDGDTFVRRGTIDGDAWTDVELPADYWATPSSNLWTPAVFPHIEADGKLLYYLFYSAKVDGTTDKHCIGYATSPSWSGGWQARSTPLFCPRDKGWAIDADVTRGAGKTWLTLRNGAWTKRGITALGAGRLGFDGHGNVTLNTPRKILDNTGLEWTKHNSPEGLVLTIENPNAVWIDNSWYLFYSGNNWSKNRYATGLSFCGRDLVDDRCRPIGGDKAYFAYRPDPDGPYRFRAGLPAGMRLKTLPGNKRGPGAFDAFQAPDGTWWASWNYITDDTPAKSDHPVRKSRIAPLTRSGTGAAASFSVSWAR
jgi:hypothetical protein